MDLKKHKISDEIWVTDFNNEMALEFREQMLDASKNDPSKPIIIHINSYGGNVDGLASMIETMDEIPNHIVTVCQGCAMSAGAVLLSHGDSRFIGKNSRVMVHEISSGTLGDVHDIYADALAVKRLNERFTGLLAKNCNFKGGYKALRKKIKSQDGRDNYMDAKEALKFGIVDAIGVPKIAIDLTYRLILLPDKRKKHAKK